MLPLTKVGLVTAADECPTGQQQRLIHSPRLNTIPEWNQPVHLSGVYNKLRREEVILSAIVSRPFAAIRTVVYPTGIPFVRFSSQPFL